MNAAEWSKSERMLLDALTNRVAVLTVSDARRIWNCCSDNESFRRALPRLVRGQLIELYEVSVRKAARSSQPILHVLRGQHSEVDCVGVSRRLKERWTRSQHGIRVMTASRTSANLFGSSASGLPTLGHREHDVLLGNVFTHYASNAPDAARKWIGEHALPKAGYRIKDPDAFLADQGVPYRIVESGGSYGAAQVKSLVEFAHEQNLELEVW
jgi:hypothetical protein